MNQTYISIYDTLDNTTVLEAKLQSTLEDLGRNEELWRKMEAAKVSQVEKISKIRDENEELKGKLWDSQASLQALANDHNAVIDKDSVLEARARAAEERTSQEEFIRDATIQETVGHVVDKFKQSKELRSHYDYSAQCRL